MPYGYSRSITIDHTLCGVADSSNFPVLVHLSDASFKTVANGGKVENASGYDIVFYADAAKNTPLKWDIYSYDGVTGDFLARVKIPLLSASSDTVIYVFYGNPAVSTFQSVATDVYDSYYKGFWRMDESPAGSAPQVTDRTINGNHGTCQGSMGSGDLVSGQVESALHFDGTDDAISCGTGIVPTQTGPYTGSCWVNGQGIAGKAFSARGVIGICRQSTETYNFLFDWDHYQEVGDETLGFNSNTLGDYPDVRTTTQVSPTGWQHIGFTFDGSNVQFYINGVLDSAPAWSAGNLPDNTAAGNAQTFKIGGRRPGVATFLEGYIDEVKFSFTKRSASWFAAEFNNENDPDAFITLGVETVVPGSVSSAFYNLVGA